MVEKVAFGPKHEWLSKVGLDPVQWEFDPKSKDRLRYECLERSPASIFQSHESHFHWISFQKLTEELVGVFFSVHIIKVYKHGRVEIAIERHDFFFSATVFQIFQVSCFEFSQPLEFELKRYQTWTILFKNCS